MNEITRMKYIDFTIPIPIAINIEDLIDGNFTTFAEQLTADYKGWGINTEIKTAYIKRLKTEIKELIK